MKKRIDRVDIRGVAKIGAIRSGGLLRAIKITEESKRGLKTKACERSGRARRKANHPQIASHAGLSKRVDGLKEGFKVRELATTIVATAVVRAAGPQESNEKPRGVHVYPLLARVNKIPFRRSVAEPRPGTILPGTPGRSRGEKTFRCADCIYRHAEPQRCINGRRC